MGRALGRMMPCARIPNASRIRGIASAGGAALLGLTLLFSDAAQAQTTAALPSPTKTLVSTGKADPIRAWSELCRETPGECGVNVAENPVISLTPEVWQRLA